MANIENPYFYQGTQTFKNKMGIESQDQLRRFEYMATSLNARELAEKPIKGNYDLEHLSKIHEHLFKETYEWAGKARTLNFSKKDPVDQTWTTDFAKVDKLKPLSDEISKNLADKNHLKGLDKDTFVKELSNTYQKLNELHPFPEGNGRSTQIMIAQLAKDAGYKLNFKAVESDRWNEAAARSLPQRNLQTGEVRQPDMRYINDVFQKVVSPLEKDKALNDKAAAFVNEDPKKATEKYPELVNAYAIIEIAKRTAARYSTLEEQSKFVNSVKTEITEKLNNGEKIPPVSIKERSQEATQKPIDRER